MPRFQNPLLQETPNEAIFDVNTNKRKLLALHENKPELAPHQARESTKNNYFL